jgi:hypothetical protein
MNQPPLLIIKWPQCSHSRVRSTSRNRAERGIALLRYGRERERVLSVFGAGNRSNDDTNHPTSN